MNARARGHKRSPPSANSASSAHILDICLRPHPKQGLPPERTRGATSTSLRPFARAIAWSKHLRAHTRTQAVCSGSLRKTPGNSGVINRSYHNGIDRLQVRPSFSALAGSHISSLSPGCQSLAMRQQVINLYDMYNLYIYDLLYIYIYIYMAKTR
jgi:hypothetical protein